MSKIKFAPLPDRKPEPVQAAPQEAAPEGVTQTEAAPAARKVRTLEPITLEAPEVVEVPIIARLGTVPVEDVRPIIDRTSGEDSAKKASRIAQHLIDHGTLPDSIGPAWRVEFSLATGEIPASVARAFRISRLAPFDSLLDLFDQIDRAGLGREKIKALLTCREGDARSWHEALAEAKGNTTPGGGSSYPDQRRGGFRSNLEARAAE